MKKHQMLGFGMGLFTEKLRGQGYFDDVPYEAPFTFTGPMDTLKALTDWGQGTQQVYYVTTLILVSIFLAVSIPLFLSLTKFRVPSHEDPQKKPLPKQTQGNLVLEILWTTIPAILLVIIAIPTWKAIFNQGKKPPENALIVEVVGHQWWWEFRYPSLNITTANEVHLPEGSPVHFRLSSADVLHSFWIPQWGGKIDALPGKSGNYLFLNTPKLQNPKNKGGEFYQGQCAELCGLSHALMRFEAVVHSKEEFEKWAKAHNTPPRVASSLEKQGEMVFTICASCHTIAQTPSEQLEKDLRAMDPPQFKIGPNLTNFGSRRTLGAGLRKNTAENVIQWIHDPESFKPGSHMKAQGLSHEDLAAVTAYLRFSTAKDY